MIRFLILFIIPLVLHVSFPAVAEVLPVTWAEGFHSTGPNDDVNDLIHWNGDVVAAGAFDAVGSVITPSRVAIRTGGSWQPLGLAGGGGDVLRLLVHDGALHALRSVSGSVKQLQRRDGDEWVPVGPELTIGTNALASFQGDLYLGAYRLEDDQWVNRLQTDGTVNTITIHGTQLVAGGLFTSAAGVATGHVLAWDGVAISAAYAGQDSMVVGLASWRDELYAVRRPGGGPDSCTAVQVWRDGAWLDVEEFGQAWPTYKYYTDIEAAGDRLMVCVWWETPLIKRPPKDPSRSMFGGYVHAWDGEALEVLAYDAGFIRHLTVLPDGDGALVGGHFNTPGASAACHNLGHVAGAGMQPVCAVGWGATSTVSLLVTNGDDLAVGGGFRGVGGLATTGVALHDGTGWHKRDLTNGAEIGDVGQAMGLAWHGSTLYGLCTGYNGGAVTRWTGSQWDYPQTSFDFPNFDQALVVGGTLLGRTSWSGLYYFPSADNPTPFADLDGGRARTMLDWNGDLLLGGDFEQIDGIPMQNLARFDASGGWSEFAGGTDEPVHALGHWQGELAVVTERDGSYPVYVIHGSLWEEIGMIEGSWVRSVQEHDGHLFIGGSFSSPADDGTIMQGLACWDGATWHSVGCEGNVIALAEHAGQLWVGGQFRFQAGRPAWNLAALNLDVTTVQEPNTPDSAPNLVWAHPNPFNPRAEISFEVPRSGLVRVDVISARGERVATLVNGHLPAGLHQRCWDAVDHRGRDLPSGTYVLRLSADDLVSSCKVSLVR